MTDAVRRLRAKARNKRRWAKRTPPERVADTAPARLGLENKFLREARDLHPDANLTPAQLQRIADDLRAAFYAELAAKSVAARRRRGGGA